MKLISATSGGQQGEAVRYSAYGVPFLIPTGDLDGDGDRDFDDEQRMFDMVDGWEPYSIVGDLDLDGDVDFWDSLMVAGALHGRAVLSEVGNRRGYAGYEHDAAIDALCHVRHRVYLTELGRWTRRDPLGYVDGMGLYAYVGARPVTAVDPMGLRRKPGHGVDPSEHIEAIDINDETGGGGWGPQMCAPDGPCGTNACSIERAPCDLRTEDECDINVELGTWTLVCTSQECDAKGTRWLLAHCNKHHGQPKTLWDECRDTDRNCECSLAGSGLDCDIESIKDNPVEGGNETVIVDGVNCTCNYRYERRTTKKLCHGICL